MESSNSLEESKSTVRAQKSPDTNKVFGVIKRECNILNVTESNDISDDVLKPGTLIQIVTDYPAEGSHFKMREFSNWLDKYKTTIYKCAKDDYIMVTKELWPYLVTVQYQTRIQFVQNVYNLEFNLDMIQLDCLICIRGSPGSNAKNYEFQVTHNGAVKEKGIGYFIGLMWMNEHIPLASELLDLSEHYRFGGTGIVVSADWIMLNLYTEDSYPSVPQRETIPSVVKSINDIKKPVKLNKIEVISKMSHRSVINERDHISGSIKNSEITKCDLCFKTVKIDYGVILRECLHSYCMQCIQHHVKYKSNKANIQCPYNKEYKCESFLWDAEIKDVVKSIDDIKKPVKLNKIEVISKMSHRSGINERDQISGSIKNSEITECDLCFKTVKIDYGVILRECLHSYCMQCIRHHVKYKSNKSNIQCPYNKEYKCESFLWDAEIKDLCDKSVYNEIQRHRSNEQVDTDCNARVCPNENCNYIWTPNWKSKERTQCQKCQCYLICHCKACPHVSGEKQRNQVIRMRKQKCSNRANVLLSLCNHSFCNTCIYYLIEAQVYFANKMSINCTECDCIIAYSDISRYGSEELLSKFQSKVKDKKVYVSNLCSKITKL